MFCLQSLHFVASVECAEGVLVVFYSLHSQKEPPHHSLPLSHHSLPLTKVSGRQHSLSAPTHTSLHLKVLTLHTQTVSTFIYT